MSKTQATPLWEVAKPYWIVGKIAVLVLGSLAYLQFVEVFRKFPKASKALEKEDEESQCSAWDKQDVIDLR